MGGVLDRTEPAMEGGRSASQAQYSSSILPRTCFWLSCFPSFASHPLFDFLLSTYSSANIILRLLTSFVLTPVITYSFYTYSRTHVMIYHLHLRWLGPYRGVTWLWLFLLFVGSTRLHPIPAHHTWDWTSRILRSGVALSTLGWTCWGWH
ncbi:hypothetical protein P154DRAFT_143776 [Amniculicola lignicola CBS 123094]|uniref:Uncharacterized protein n=1 Tax=Amniculicola lignicola CBS 123094 TaxID=1392246 RepID=A0A6A5WK75_9PLEO|nr:hypothetical protein P154DRAFT_143776 [Amniculicola lignicola CBS 123094]